MNFFILTLGCKVNQCESEDISLAMCQNGFLLSQNFETADVVIVNSCAVTSESIRKARQTVHKIRSKNKNCTLVLTGCFPQAETDQAKQILDADIIIGNKEKAEIPKLIDEYLINKKRVFDVGNIFEIKFFQNSVTNCTPHRSRAFLKIEDGCNRFCSYCIIPYARGKVRSKSLESISQDVKLFAKNGYKEVVLVGINLSSYGMDIGKNLADAVDAVCDVDGIERVRLGSLEPDLMPEEIIKRLSKQPKLCPQFHLALQSGSNKILKSMRRRYSREEYISVVKNIKKHFNNATFTTDLIVGFPGESKEDFEDSLSLINEVGFLKVHVFPYSVRPGTLAEKFDEQVDKKTKSLRVKKTMEVSEKISKKILDSFIGKNCDVFYETVDKNGMYEGYTKEYLPVKTKSKVDLRGKVVSTTMGKVENHYIVCECY